jgi:ATP-dependent Clp endopeptidase proteolytic subunit ClpP
VKNRFRLEVKGNTAELYIYDQIGESMWGGGCSASSMNAQLQELSSSIDTIDCHVNSPGGDVFDGVAIYNMLAQHSAHVNMIVDALAASAASVICMAGDKILMPENAMMMIHDPWTMCVGNAADMRKLADDLDKIRDVIAITYQRRTGKDLAEIKNLMTDETWMDGQECVDRGFADEIIPAKAAPPANSYKSSILATYRRIPERFKNAAAGSSDFPLSERGHVWDSYGADERWRSYCSSDGSGSKEKMDWPKYRSGHFYYDPSNSEAFGSYKLGFVDVLAGTPTAVWRGIQSVAQRLDSTEIPDADKETIRTHAEKYYEAAAKQYNDDTIAPPWKNLFEGTLYLRERMELLKTF